MELTSNITDDTIFDEPEPVLPDPKEPSHSSNIPPVIDEEEDEASKRMLEAVMGPEGGEGWLWNTRSEEDNNTDPPDDLLATVSKAMVQKIDQRLWEVEDLKPEEIPE